MAHDALRGLEVPPRAHAAEAVHAVDRQQRVLENELTGDLISQRTTSGLVQMIVRLHCLLWNDTLRRRYMAGVGSIMCAAFRACSYIVVTAECLVDGVAPLQM